MAIWSFTTERLERLKEQIAKKKKEHDDLLALSEKDLWCTDLDAFVEEWERQLRLDAEIQTSINRLGRRVSKKIGAGRGRKGATKEDDEYDPGKKTKGRPKKAATTAAPKVETKAHQRFAEMFTAKAAVRPKEEKDEDEGLAGGSDGFSDNDFAALSRPKSSAVVAPKAESVEPSEIGAARSKRAAAVKPKTWVVDSDSDEEYGDKLLGDVSSMVKGIKKADGDGNSASGNGRLSLFTMSRPESQGQGSSAASALPKMKSKPSRTFDFEEFDDETNYEMLAKSSPRKSIKGDDIDELLSDDDDFPPAKAAPKPVAAAAAAAPAAKRRGRPAGATNKAKDEAKPAAKVTKAKAAATKQTTLSPAAKAYAARKATKKVVLSDDDDDDVDAMEDVSEEPAPAPRRGRPARAAATKPKAKPRYVDSEDEEDEGSFAAQDEDSDDPFAMDSD